MSDEEVDEKKAIEPENEEEENGKLTLLPTIGQLPTYFGARTDEGKGFGVMSMMGSWTRVRDNQENKTHRITADDVKYFTQNQHFGVRTSTIAINLNQVLQRIYDADQRKRERGDALAVRKRDAEMKTRIDDEVSQLVIDSIDEILEDMKLPMNEREAGVAANYIWPHALSNHQDMIVLVFRLSTTTQDNSQENRRFVRVCRLFPRKELTLAWLTQFLEDALIVDSVDKHIVDFDVSFQIVRENRAAAGGFGNARNRQQIVTNLEDLKSKHSVITFENSDNKCIFQAVLFAASMLGHDHTNGAYQQLVQRLRPEHQTVEMVQFFNVIQPVSQGDLRYKYSKKVKTLVELLYAATLKHVNAEDILVPIMGNPANGFEFDIQRTCQALEEVLSIRIVVYDQNSIGFVNPEPLIVGNKERTPTVVLLRYPIDNNLHHVAVVKKPHCLFGERNHRDFCYICWKPIMSWDEHKCNDGRLCYICKIVHEDVDGYTHYCNRCNRFFQTEQCLTNHAKKICDTRHVCRKCHVTFDPRKKQLVDEKGDHRCNCFVCKNCKEIVEVNLDEEHQCCIQMPEVTLPVSKFIFFDIETMPLEKFATDSSSGNRVPIQRELYPNVVCAQFGHIIPYSLEPTKNIKKMQEANLPAESYVTFVSHPGEPMNAVDKFVKFLLDQRALLADSTIIAHNGSGFDFGFIKEACHRAGGNMEISSIIMRGTRIFKMVLKKLQYRFIDSFNFFAHSLAKMPISFGFNVMKGNYPHAMNTVEANRKNGEPLPWPGLEVWHIDDLKPEDRISLIKDLLGMMEHYYPEAYKRAARHWYSLVAGCKDESILRTFYAQAQADPGIVWLNEKFLVDYCQRDVTVLRMGMTRFSEVFSNCVKSICKDSERANLAPEFTAEEICDPLAFTTIAGACQYVHQRFCMPKDSILCFREATGSRTHSYSAMEWLNWLAHDQKLNIRTACTSINEVALGPYRLDGFTRGDPARNIPPTMYEYKGCYFHCHTDPKCPFNGGSAKQWSRNSRKHIASRDAERDAFIKQICKERGYQYVFIWECDWQKMKKQDGHILEALKHRRDLIDFTPLDPRKAQFGGRVETIKPYVNYDQMSTHGRSGDVCSLYPFVMSHFPYPGEQRRIITCPQPIDYITGYDEDEHEQLAFGLYYVDVLPPDDLFIPVLPMKCKMSNGQEKLIFTLCQTCAQQMNSHTRCAHTEKERSFTGIFASPELQLALNKGYHILNVYEVQLFNPRTDLFQSYVYNFYRLKTIYSGYGDVIDWCKLYKGEEFNAAVERWIQHTPDSDATALLTQEQIELKVLQEDPRFLQAFCEDFSTRFIPLAPEDIQPDKNEALRTVLKIMLNSLWGKYGERLVATQQVNTTDPSVLQRHMRQYMDDEIEDFEFIIHHNTAVVNYRKPTTQAKDNFRMSIYISIFTTAWARVHLYHLLDMNPHLVQYYDTDSMYWINRPDFEVDFGVMLGEFAKDAKSRIIGEWFSLGAKNKDYQLEDPIANAKLKPTCKGITMNQNNIKLFRQSVRRLLFIPHAQVEFPRHFVVKRDSMTGEVHELVGSVPKKQLKLLESSQEEDDEIVDELKELGDNDYRLEPNPKKRRIIVRDQEFEKLKLKRPMRVLSFINDKRVPVNVYRQWLDPSTNELHSSLAYIDTIPYGYRFKVITYSEGESGVYVPEE